MTNQDFFNTLPSVEDRNVNIETALFYISILENNKRRNKRDKVCIDEIKFILLKEKNN